MEAAGPPDLKIVEQELADIGLTSRAMYGLTRNDDFEIEIIAAVTPELVDPKRPQRGATRFVVSTMELGTFLIFRVPCLR